MGGTGANSVTGVVGLGNMGSVLAGNLVAAGHEVVTYDTAGAAGTPPGAAFAGALDEVARLSDVVVCSLPDGAASESVARAVATAAGRRATHVVDTSTIGVAAARVVYDLLAAAGIGFVDAPVSGGVAGARARTLVVMYAGTDEHCAAVAPVLAGLSDRRYRVGTQAGMGQALKLANNFLSATALAATSEAVAFGVSVGLSPATMVEVLNVSSGRSAATSDKFPNHVISGRYAAGFANALMVKDLQLYLGSVGDQRTASELGHAALQVWERFAAAEPDADFTRIYPFVEGGAGTDPQDRAGGSRPGVDASDG